MGERDRPALFDAHLHVIDPRFPLVPNNGYLPAPFTVADYRARTSHLHVVGGAVVSGSFQGFDQSYLSSALAELGPGFVGVTQLPAEVSAEEILHLDGVGVRAVRVNVRRGGSATVNDLEQLAHRVHEVAGWHTELYVDARDLGELMDRLLTLPQLSIDHLGLSREGLPALLRLVEGGARVKATGFSRGDLSVVTALRVLAAANPAALVVGTDLPSTRAPYPFDEDDLDLVVRALGHDVHLLEAAFHGNAAILYRL